jgi:hypothetical protein
MPHKGACLCGQTTVELKSTHPAQVRSSNSAAAFDPSDEIISPPDCVPLYGLQTDKWERVQHQRSRAEEGRHDHWAREGVQYHGGVGESWYARVAVWSLISTTVIF